MTKSKFPTPRKSSTFNASGKLHLLLAFIILASLRLRTSAWLAFGLFALLLVAAAVGIPGLPPVVPDDAKDIWIIGF